MYGGRVDEVARPDRERADFEDVLPRREFIPEAAPVRIGNATRAVVVWIFGEEGLSNVSVPTRPPCERGVSASVPDRMRRE